MSVGWSGADPTGFSDGGGSSYELGTKYTAVGDVTVNGVRVWAPVGGAARANRAGKIWSNGGSLLATATMPDTLPSGWNTYPLDSDVEVPAGTTVVVSYDVTDTYGALTSGTGYPRASADTLVNAISGQNNLSTPDAFPNNTAATTFYGVDLDYDAGLVGNNRPTVGLTVTANNLVAAATLTIDDEDPGSVTYVIEWGDGQSSNVTGLGPHSHTYTAAGRFAVMVTATDNGGLTDSAAVVVEVFALGPMDLAVIMDEISARLDTIGGLRCFAWPPGTASPPAAIVGYPTEYRYDETYGRGMDRLSLPVVILIGRATDRTARDRLAVFINGSGTSSVKAVLESGVYTAFHTLRVTGVDFDVYQLGGTDYLAAIFDLDIAGQGSA